ncbi:MAG: molybdopterin-dependent oxidoreductase [Thermoplasmata archaeon]|nr:MAG: molybdopterin-dependent oxidoreductase [Thermoplasmata archaeon]
MNKYRAVLVLFLVIMAVVLAWVINDVATEGEITPNDEFFELSIGRQPDIDGDAWTLTITGLVENETVLSLADIRAMNSTEVTAILKCVEGPSGTAVWRGVPLGEVLDAVGVQDGAEEVVFRASDGYHSSLTMEEAYEGDVLLCYEMNGEPLPRGQGYPLKLVAPGKYGYKWVKWIHTIEVVDYDHKGYWESRGWDDHAEITPLAEWAPHALGLTVAAILGGFSLIGGLRFSRETRFWRDLPEWFNRGFHVGVSWGFFAVLYPVFAYWVVTTVIRRGDIFYSSHGILALLSVSLLTIGLVMGYALERGREDVRSFHLVSNLMGYLLLLATIAFGLIRI